MALTQTNSAPAVPALRYSIADMLLDANDWAVGFDTRLMVAWAMPESAGRDHHMRALINQWVAVRDWVRSGVYVEADYDALCDAAFAVAGAFDVWVLAMEVGA